MCHPEPAVQADFDLKLGFHQGPAPISTYAFVCLPPLSNGPKKFPTVMQEEVKQSNTDDQTNPKYYLHLQDSFSDFFNTLTAIFLKDKLD